MEDGFLLLTQYHAQVIIFIWEIIFSDLFFNQSPTI